MIFRKDPAKPQPHARIWADGPAGIPLFSGRPIAGRDSRLKRSGQSILTPGRMDFLQERNRLEALAGLVRPPARPSLGPRNAILSELIETSSAAAVGSKTNARLASTKAALAVPGCFNGLTQKRSPDAAPYSCCCGQRTHFSIVTAGHLAALRRRQSNISGLRELA